MPSFALATHSSAAVEEVWKLLHDPSSYPRWWTGLETVQVRRVTDVEADYTVWTEGFPDFPMDQIVRHGSSRVTVSCLVSDLVFTWQLAEAGDGTDIEVRLDLPEREAHRLATQRALIESSLTRLAELAVLD